MTLKCRVTLNNLFPPKIKSDRQPLAAVIVNACEIPSKLCSAANEFDSHSKIKATCQTGCFIFHQNQYDRKQRFYYKLFNLFVFLHIGFGGDGRIFGGFSLFCCCFFYIICFLKEINASFCLLENKCRNDSM